MKEYKNKYCILGISNTIDFHAKFTIAAKIDHDISFSIHNASERKWRDITPYFKGSVEGVIYDFLI